MLVSYSLCHIVAECPLGVLCAWSVVSFPQGKLPQPVWCFWWRMELWADLTGMDRWITTRNNPRVDVSGKAGGFDFNLCALNICCMHGGPYF